MYSSLLKIDLAATKDPQQPMFIQTDHRSRDEIAAEPEVSVLFALTRVLNARHHGAQHGLSNAMIVYACMDEPTPELVEALAACGAVLETKGGESRTALEPVAATPSELADQAFRGLADRVKARVGLRDPASALRVLEAETLADRPDPEEDEPGYWTRILELAALTAEVLRAKHGGVWVECDRADVPFGFQWGATGVTLPTNRAGRFIHDGAEESMFHLLATHDEERPSPTTDDPLLPSLRTRSEVEREKMVFRPLLDKNTDPDFPVIAYGNDTPTSFGLLTLSGHTYSDEMHARALANLEGQKVEVAEIEVGGVALSAVSGSFYATEKVLDRAFMLEMHETYGDVLAAIVPRRGLMFVTSAVGDDPIRTMSVLAVIAEEETKTSRRISPAVLIVTDGEVTGYAQLAKKDAEPEAEPERASEPPKKKPGFFKRLFGKG
jgi:hypothetical protein